MNASGKAAVLKNIRVREGRDYARLTDAQKAAVSEAIALARATSGQHTVRVGDGTEAYAIREPRGGIRWGVLGTHYGMGLAGGIEPD